MDAWVVVIAIVISILATIAYYFGAIGVILVIAAAIFGFYKLFISEGRQQKIDQENSPYVAAAMQFLVFYDMLPVQKICFTTPEMIGVRLNDNDESGNIGIRIKTYLDFMQSNPAQQAVWTTCLHEHISQYLGGPQVLEAFIRLNLQVKLHDNDDDRPVIYYPLYCGSLNQQKQYAEIIKKLYKKANNKDLYIHCWVEY